MIQSDYLIFRGVTHVATISAINRAYALAGYARQAGKDSLSPDCYALDPFDHAAVQEAEDDWRYARDEARLTGDQAPERDAWRTLCDLRNRLNL